MLCNSPWSIVTQEQSLCISASTYMESKYRRGEAIFDETFHWTPEREYLQAKSSDGPAEMGPSPMILLALEGEENILPLQPE